MTWISQLSCCNLRASRVRCAIGNEEKGNWTRLDVFSPLLLVASASHHRSFHFSQTNGLPANMANVNEYNAARFLNCGEMRMRDAEWSGV